VELAKAAKQLQVALTFFLADADDLVLALPFFVSFAFRIRRIGGHNLKTVDRHG